MHTGTYIFSQIMDALPRRQFDRCVAAYGGHHRMKHFTCREQFLAMAFGQFAHRDSIRDIVSCLEAQRSKQYHLGFRSRVTRSTLSHANKHRDWRIYRDFAEVLVSRARALYVEDPEFMIDLDGACYALDSTSIDLCLSLFPWAPYVATKGAVKIHTQMDLRGSIPALFHITSGKINDVNFLDLIEYEQGAHYIMDRGYTDYERLFTIHRSGAFFVIRARENMAWRRLYSEPVDRSGGLRCDQTIRLTGVSAAHRYPEKLRRIKYYDTDTDRYYVFLTNDFTAPAQTIADLYRYRWQIELFFRWIKQHLKIKTFWGTSENAVKTQICIAIASYLLVAILKKQLGIHRRLSEILQILSVSLFDTTPLVELFSDDGVHDSEEGMQQTLPLSGC